MKKLTSFLFFTLLILCSSAWVQAQPAVAELHGTKADSKISGEIHFDQTPEGVKVRVVAVRIWAQGISPKTGATLRA